MKNAIIITTVIFLSTMMTHGQTNFEKDVVETSVGNLEMTFIGHGTLMFMLNDYVIHIDPVSRYAEYGLLPDADLVLVTHEHGDHLDIEAIANIRKQSTVVVCSQISARQLDNPIVMNNGDTEMINGIRIQAVPAYNIEHKRENGDPFHSKGDGNGYVLSMGDTKVYIAGDTENVPEMADLIGIDIAFLPMNLPYTMTPRMVADAVELFNPAILYPYHFGSTNTDEIVDLLKDNEDCEVRIRKLQ